VKSGRLCVVVTTTLVTVDVTPGAILLHNGSGDDDGLVLGLEGRLLLHLGGLGDGGSLDVDDRGRAGCGFGGRGLLRRRSSGGFRLLRGLGGRGVIAGISIGTGGIAKVNLPAGIDIAETVGEVVVVLDVGLVVAVIGAVGLKTFAAPDRAILVGVHLELHGDRAAGIRMVSNLVPETRLAAGAVAALAVDVGHIDIVTVIAGVRRLVIVLDLGQVFGIASVFAGDLDRDSDSSLGLPVVLLVLSAVGNNRRRVRRWAAGLPHDGPHREGMAAPIMNCDTRLRWIVSGLIGATEVGCGSNSGHKGHGRGDTVHFGVDDDSLSGYRIWTQKYGLV